MQDKKKNDTLSQIDDWNLVGDNIEVWFYLEGNDNPPFISVDKEAFDNWIIENDHNWSVRIDSQMSPSNYPPGFCEIDYRMGFEEYSKDMDFMKERLSEYLHETFFKHILNLKS